MTDDGRELQLSLAVDPGDQGSDRDREGMLEDLRRDLAEAGIKVAFQPGRSVPGAKTTGIELLVLSLVSGLVPAVAQIVTSVLLARRDKPVQVYVVGSDGELEELAGTTPEEIERTLQDKAGR